MRSPARLLAPAIWLAAAAVSAESAPGGVFPEEREWVAAAAAESDAYAHDLEAPERSMRQFRRAAALFEAVAQARTEPAGVAAASWRSARCHWLVADFLADTPGEDAEAERLRLYEHAESLAQQGIDADPTCAPCMLWKFSSMGRLATTRGIWVSMWQVPDMAALLDRGIALAPTHVDHDDSSVLGNLHYSSAIFYRVMPDWFLMTLLFGVRGDKDRSLRHIQTALSLHPGRLEYQVELGSQLLCRGATDDDPVQLEQGRAVLENSLEREVKRRDDVREIAAANIMLAEPARSCGYSGDTWIEIDRNAAEQVLLGDSEAAPEGAQSPK